MKIYSSREIGKIIKRTQCVRLPMLCPVSDCHSGTCNLEVCIVSLFRADEFACYGQETKLRHPELISTRKRYLASMSKSRRRRIIYPNKAYDIFEKYCSGSINDSDLLGLPKCIYDNVEKIRVLDPLCIFK